MTQTGIFKGRVQIPYSYGRFGWTRGGGKTWHGGIDLVGPDDATIRMPYYTAPDGTQKAIRGKVITARIVTDHSNRTWEWGWYVCVQLDADQTPDAVNYLYFCHCERLLVQAGQKVQSGDALAVMGNSGNAALNDPPYKHCHLEARATATGTGVDPTAYSGTPNTTGCYGTAADPAPAEESLLQIMTIGPVSNSDAMILWGIANKYSLGYDAQYTDSTKTAQVLTIGPASAGDAMTVWAKAQELGAPYKSEYVER